MASHPPSASTASNPTPVTPTRPLTARATTNTQRFPPPSLFQGPPSRNGSHISLSLPGAAGSSQQTPVSRPSHLYRGGSFSSTSNSPPTVRQNQPPVTQKDSDRADALWADMQNTLAEVELSATSSSHIFGASHARALDELRVSQLALAHEWAKSEADEMGGGGDHTSDDDGGASATIGILKESALNKRTSPKSAAVAKSGVGNATRAKNLEDDTDRDIELAKKRREANDRYFTQVNGGVLDVVAKLNEVASAMRRVEKESREMWSDSSSGASRKGSVGMADSTLAARSRSGTGTTADTALSSSPLVHQV